jgi:FkbM family methyltransferase
MTVLIPVKELTNLFQVRPKSVLHVGAHDAEELQDYERYGWLPVEWVEAQPDKAQLLRERLPKLNHKLTEAAVWNEPNISLELKVMTNSASTSLFNLGTHSKEHPDIKFSHSITVKTATLESLFPNRSFDLIALDIQGAELRALQGFATQLSETKWIYCEVNSQELYEGCCTVKQLDEYLAPYGFKRVATRWTRHHWGDALYRNKSRTMTPSARNSTLWSLSQLAYYCRALVGKLLSKLRKFSQR